MSWTGDRKVAERFRDAHQVDHTRPSKLWTVTVGPDRLLAHYHLKPRFRYEDEYVINPIGLRPRENRRAMNAAPQFAAERRTLSAACDRIG